VARVRGSILRVSDPVVEAPVQTEPAVVQKALPLGQPYGATSPPLALRGTAVVVVERRLVETHLRLALLRGSQGS